MAKKRMSKKMKTQQDWCLSFAIHPGGAVVLGSTGSSFCLFESRAQAVQYLRETALMIESHVSAGEKP